MEYYSEIKRNKLMHIKALNESLKYVFLKRRQTQKNKDYTFIDYEV